MKSKRQLAAILALITFTFTVFPQKPSYAFAPLIPIAAAEIVGAGGAATLYSTVAGSTAGYIAAGAAGAIGLIGAYLQIKDAQDNAIRIPLGPNEQNNPPQPSAAASVAPTQTAQGSWADGWGGSGYSSGEAACSAAASAQRSYCQSLSPAWTGGGPIYGGGSTCSATCCLDSGGCNTFPQSISYTGQTTVNTCGSGYTLSGNTCTLTNPRQAANDKTCDLLVSMGQFATADDQNCSATADGSKLAPLVRNGNVIAYGTNSSGQPLMWTVTPGPQTYTVAVSEQVVTPSQTQVQTTTIAVDAATGQVISAQTTTAPGQIAAPSGATVPTTSTTPTTTNTPTVTTSPATTVIPDIKFPSDYARQGEAASAAQSITTSTDAIRDQLKSTENVTDPSAPVWADPWGTTFANLKGWSLPGHSSICPVGSFAWNNQAYSIDSHCQLVTNYWGVLQGAMSVVWAIIALFIVLGA